jgi:subtilase family serine protease
MFLISTRKHPLLRSSVRYTACGVLGVLFAAATASLHAQQTAPVAADRITHEIDNSSLTTLKGNIHPLANARNDLGAAPVSQPLNHMQLVLARSAAQEAALESFLASAQVKGSPNYHKWLTPQQFGKLYGPSDNDIQKLTGWLQSEGFTVNRVSKGRTAIDFSGSAAQVQSAFRTSIHSYRANGITFLANSSNPRIPAAIASVVTGIAHLNTFPIQPTYVKGIPASYDHAAHKFAPLPTASALPRAHSDLTQQDNSGNYYLFTVPGDAATIYDTPNSTFNANFSGAAAYDGTGVTIGIAGQSAIDPTIVANYRTLFLGDSKQPTIINLDNVGDVSGDDTESYLDNELAGALAPGASLVFYTESSNDGGVLGAAAQAVDDNGIQILSVSYGNCESFNGTSGNQYINSLWQQAAAQGITVVVSTGDTGSAGCDSNTDSQGNTITQASYGLAINGLASTPYNIAVGGTDFNFNNNFSQYASTSTGSSSTFFRTAKSYIPETTWNDSTSNNGSVANNAAWSLASGLQNISAGGGGQSTCSTNTTTSTTIGTCTSGYPKPSWQTGLGVPNNNSRYIPDVSFLAGDGFVSALWTVCDNSTQSSGNTTVTEDCSVDSSGNFYFDGVGGTSAATPTFASILALVVQKTGLRQGQAAPVLYSLFNSGNAASVFHDVTTGNNSVPCTLTTYNTADCLTDSVGSLFESGYDTNAGYDLATGLGSVDATALVNNWSNASALLTPTLTITPSSTEIAPSQSFTVAVTVAGASGSATPTGSVTLSTGDYISDPVDLSSGSATLTVPANTLSAGSSYIQVGYTPDAASSSVYYAGSATTIVDIGGTFALTSTAATASSPGQSGTSTVTVTPKNGYTGTVNFSFSLTNAPSGASTAYNPQCSATAAKITGTGAVTTTATCTTTAPTTGALAYPDTNRRPEQHWYTAAGGAALACLLFFGIPARRRGWKSMLSLLVFLVAMAGVGCGGGGGNNNNNGTPGTTTGTYTYTVTGTDSVTNTITSTTTLTLTVN